MQKKLTLSFITLLSSASIFIACEDNSIMDVSSNNIDKLADVEVVSVTAQSSADIVAEVSSTEAISSEEVNGSSQDITNLSQKTDGSSETQGSSTDIFNKSSEVELSSKEEDLSSQTPLSSTPASSQALSSVALSSTTASSNSNNSCETAWDANNSSGYGEGTKVSAGGNNYEACKWNDAKLDPKDLANQVPAGATSCPTVWADKKPWLDLGPCS